MKWADDVTDGVYLGLILRRAPYIEIYGLLQIFQKGVGTFSLGKGQPSKIE